MKLTTASKITIVRVLLIPAVLVLMYLDFPGHMYWALGVFVLASVSDFVDGYIARHYNQVSNFGKFLDPLADKLLVISVMLVYVDTGLFPAWAAIIASSREVFCSLALTCTPFALRLCTVSRFSPRRRSKYLPCADAASFLAR